MEWRICIQLLANIRWLPRSGEAVQPIIDPMCGNTSDTSCQEDRLPDRSNQGTESPAKIDGKSLFSILFLTQYVTLVTILRKYTRMV